MSTPRPALLAQGHPAYAKVLGVVVASREASPSWGGLTRLCFACPPSLERRPCRVYQQYHLVTAGLAGTDVELSAPERRPRYRTAPSNNAMKLTRGGLEVG